MQVRFLYDQIQQAEATREQYIKAISAIISRPDHHGFDAICAYLVQIDKMMNVLYSVIQARTNEMMANTMAAGMAGDYRQLDRIEASLDKPKLEQELQAEISKHLVTDSVKQVDEQYKALDSRITGFVCENNVKNQLNKFLLQGHSAMPKTFCVKFSDDTQLTWNANGDAQVLAAARSEFEHKMAYLANANQAEDAVSVNRSITMTK